MSFFLSQLLNHRAPIVIGYAGWDHDVIMTALHSRLRERPASSVYWFCYSHRAFSDLPGWLRESPYVKFILPAAPAGGSHGATDGQLDPADDDEPPDHHAEETQLEPRLSAVEIIDHLNERFEIEEPLLTRDPFEYLAKRLEPMLASRDKASGDTDPYDFSSVARRLRHAAERERLERKDSEKTLERLRNLIRRSNYKRACAVAAETERSFVFMAKGGDIEPLREYVQLYRQAVRGADLAGDDVGRSRLASASESLAEASKAYGDQLMLAEVYLDQGKALSRGHKHDLVIPVLDRGLAALPTTSDPNVSVIRHESLVGKGMNLLYLARDNAEGYRTLDEVIAAEPANSADLITIIYAYRCKARFLMSAKRATEALEAYAAVVRRFITDPLARSQVIRAALEAARAANRLKKYDDTLRYVKSIDPLVASTRSARDVVRLKELQVPKGIALRERGLIDDALTCFETYIDLDEAEKRYANRPARMNAYLLAARLLAKKGELSKARDLYRAGIAEYESDKDDHVKQHVAEARRELEGLAEGSEIAAPTNGRSHVDEVDAT